MGDGRPYSSYLITIESDCKLLRNSASRHCTTDILIVTILHSDPLSLGIKMVLILAPVIIAENLPGVAYKESV
ncbi:hypothetical protein ISN44_As09g000830 [Arabidopsis suecica]|uniref:Uncharacterized protein n=1 Tax=Arabidopsis suecica TaxID=45249 RepID=A0A8T2AFX4_ARASU|nr:hypothetical protein ISN44_As09g000830 [Arabidopsis suecica]